MIMVRCFVGFMLPEGVKDRIDELIAQVKGWPMDCKFVERENLHLCFSFLGEVSEAGLEEIKAKIGSINDRVGKIDVKLQGLKAIPSEKYIRVIVIDALDETGRLAELMKSVVKDVGGDSKPPHVTVCRVRGVADKQAIAAKINEMKEESFGAVTVDKVQLIKSELGRGGPIYSVLN